MRLSRDKVNKLAHVVTDAVADMDDVEFIEDRNTIRLEVRKILEQLLMQEARIDQSARMKIESQRRTIIEGQRRSQETRRVAVPGSQFSVNPSALLSGPQLTVGV